jgi:hypothetical protein
LVKVSTISGKIERIGESSRILFEQKISAEEEVSGKELTCVPKHSLESKSTPGGHSETIFVLM